MKTAIFLCLFTVSCVVSDKTKAKIYEHRTRETATAKPHDHYVKAQTVTPPPAQKYQVGNRQQGKSTTRGKGPVRGGKIPEGDADDYKVPSPPQEEFTPQSNAQPTSEDYRLVDDVYQRPAEGSRIAEEYNRPNSPIVVAPLAGSQALGYGQEIDFGGGSAFALAPPEGFRTQGQGFDQFSAFRPQVAAVYPGYQTQISDGQQYQGGESSYQGPQNETGEGPRAGYESAGVAGPVPTAPTSFQQTVYRTNVDPQPYQFSTAEYQSFDTGATAPTYSPEAQPLFLGAPDGQAPVASYLTGYIAVPVDRQFFLPFPLYLAPHPQFNLAGIGIPHGRLVERDASGPLPAEKAT